MKHWVCGMMQSSKSVKRTKRFKKAALFLRLILNCCRQIRRSSPNCWVRFWLSLINGHRSYTKRWLNSGNHFWLPLCQRNYSNYAVQQHQKDNKQISHRFVAPLKILLNYSTYSTKRSRLAPTSSESYHPSYYCHQTQTKTPKNSRQSNSNCAVRYVSFWKRCECCKRQSTENNKT